MDIDNEMHTFSTSKASCCKEHSVFMRILLFFSFRASRSYSSFIVVGPCRSFSFIPTNELSPKQKKRKEPAAHSPFPPLLGASSYWYAKKTTPIVDHVSSKCFKTPAHRIHMIKEPHFRLSFFFYLFGVGCAISYPGRGEEVAHRHGYTELTS